jgi:hypothetical protein
MRLFASTLPCLVLLACSTRDATPGPDASSDPCARARAASDVAFRRADHCFAPLTVPPAQLRVRPPAFDSNGCPAPDEVANECNGIAKVLSGPALRGAQCCYDVCLMSVVPDC